MKNFFSKTKNVEEPQKEKFQNHNTLWYFFYSRFKPSIYLPHFSQVDVKQLKEQGIKVFICDLDNTLVPHFNRLPNNEVIEFVEKIRENDIKFVIISNNVKKRVKNFVERIEVDDYVYNAKKPFPKSVRKIQKKFNVKETEMILMGDLLFTDILVANFIGIDSILVQPLISDGRGWKKFNQILENFLYKKIEKGNIFKKSDFDERYNINFEHEIL